MPPPFLQLPVQPLDQLSSVLLFLSSASPPHNCQFSKSFYVFICLFIHLRERENSSSAGSLPEALQWPLAGLGTRDSI